MDFNSVPVVNMAGKIIGIIPKNFIIILIENHAWYEHEHVGRDSREVTSFYKTHTLRQESLSLSAKSPTNKGLNGSPDDLDSNSNFPIFGGDSKDKRTEENDEDNPLRGSTNQSLDDFSPNKVDEESYRFTGASEKDLTKRKENDNSVIRNEFNKYDEERAGTMKEFTGDKDWVNAP